MDLKISRRISKHPKRRRIPLLMIFPLLSNDKSNFKKIKVIDAPFFIFVLYFSSTNIVSPDRAFVIDSLNEK